MSVPEAATTTRSSTTSGEPEMPQIGIFAPVSVAALRDHTTAPLPASRAFTMPVPPSAYTRPSCSVGVARGPAPPFDSQNRAVSRCLHTGLPVAAW